MFRLITWLFFSNSCLAFVIRAPMIHNRSWLRTFNGERIRPNLFTRTLPLVTSSQQIIWKDMIFYDMNEYNNIELSYSSRKDIQRLMISNCQDHASKLYNFTNSGKKLVHEIGKVTMFLKNVHSELSKDINQTLCDDVTLNMDYKMSLENARSIDMKFGVCSEQSNKAWKNADKIYKSLVGSMNYKSTILIHNFDEIILACRMLEQTFDIMKEIINES